MKVPHHLILSPCTIPIEAYGSLPKVASLAAYCDAEVLITSFIHFIIIAESLH